MAFCVQISKFCVSLLKKNEWPFGYNSKFRILLEKTDGRLGTTVKFCISLKKNEWTFGYNCKISYLAVKKRMAAWVQAF